jgi:thiamine-phosphate pyrophosphorylase
LAGRTLLVGASTRTLAEVASALAAGTDYVGLGAMFHTETKETPPPVGPAYVRAFRERFPEVPHLAIGGIGPGNVAEVIEAGARGVAVCGAICGADDPGEAVRTLLASVGDPHAAARG